MIKKVMISTLIAGTMAISMNANAVVNEFNSIKSTCYIFRKGKVSHKSACTYNAMSGGGMTYHVFEATFPIKNYGKISIIDNSSWQLDDNGEQINIQETTKLNNKKATVHFRDIKSLKILSNDELAQTFSDEIYVDTPNNYLTCYKSKSPELEFCYIGKTIE